MAELDACTLHLGDCLDVIAKLETGSIGAILCDPPYGLTDAEPAKVAQCLAAWLAGRPFQPEGAGFMGHGWDAWVPGPEIWRECLRVLAPGGHLLAFCGTRMHDLMSIAIRLSGFEIRDELALQWCYGQGYAKSKDIGRAIDMELCTLPGRHYDKNLPRNKKPGDHLCPPCSTGDPWRGRGSSLKPSYEPIVLARKPLAGNLARTALEYQSGALDIDACRVGSSKPVPSSPRRAAQGSAYGNLANATGDTPGFDPTVGRFPSNMLLVHHEDCRQVGTRKVKTGTAVRRNGGGGRFFGDQRPKFAGPSDDVSFADEDGYEEVPDFECVPGCPIRELDAQSGTLRSGTSNGYVGEIVESQSLGAKRSMIGRTYGDEGGASRFFPTFQYNPKITRAEREAGCEAFSPNQNGVRNDHPTVKPIALMRWLVRLVTPVPSMVVLDPFMGSGSTGIACAMEGRAFIGVEQDPRYYALARARLEWARGQRVQEADASAAPERPPMPDQQDLFR